jgi:hypothetical protein
MGAYEDAAEARIAARKAAADAADTAERARIAAAGQANAASTTLTRAQQVTAERLASSPIAQEAARTTAALKSFTAKGGLLGVPGSNISSTKAADPASLAKVGSNIFQMLGGILYFSGVPFTGTEGGKTYKNGVEVVAEGDTEDTGDTGKTGGTTYTAPDGKIFTDLNAYNAYIAKIKADEKALAGKSAYDILYGEFNKYGMGSLIEPLKKFIQDGLSKSELVLKLRETPQYQERFAANALRIKNGFAAIDEATYLDLEDKYQSIMMNYGLPASYYERGALGKQAGFENLIGGNVDPITLEERIMEGQKVLKGSKDIKDAIGQFYPGLNNSDFLAYVLDPKNALAEIKRKVAAAEIGGSAIQSGLTTNVGRAEELVAQGITKAQAQQGYGTIGGGLQRGSQLASIYGEDPYTQTTAEKEVFGLAGKTEAEKQRKKLTGLEKATFSGQSGISSGALTRDRAGAY